MHSLLDFDLSFFYNLIITYTIIAIIANKYDEKLNLKFSLNKYVEKAIYIFVIIFEVIILVFNLKIYTAKILFFKIRYESNENISFLEKVIKLDPFKEKYKEAYVNYFTNSLDDDLDKYSSCDYERINEYITFCIKNNKEFIYYALPYKDEMYKYALKLDNDNLNEYSKIIYNLFETLNIYNNTYQEKKIYIDYDQLKDILCSKNLKNIYLDKVLENMK